METVTLIGICKGGNHLTFTHSRPGEKDVVVVVTRDEIVPSLTPDKSKEDESARVCRDVAREYIAKVTQDEKATIEDALASLKAGVAVT